MGGDGIAAASRYRDAVIAAGIPDLHEGLFPPDDPLISRLSSEYKPYTKVTFRVRARVRAGAGASVRLSREYKPYTKALAV